VALVEAGTAVIDSRIENRDLDTSAGLIDADLLPDLVDGVDYGGVIQCG